MNAASADRVKRWRRRADLVHRAEHGERQPIVVGAWVVVADQMLDSPLALAQVTDGPDFIHQDGHAIDEVWTLHTGAMAHRADLTVLDVAAVLEDGARVLASICGGRLRECDDVEILRVHRTACLARKAIDTVTDQRDVLESVIAIDLAISDAEKMWREFIRVRLPNLLRALSTAGMLELARAPDWTPNISSVPHPAFKEP